MPQNNKPTFRISAAVVKQLGEELVSDELTAIMELVKNSYDADADWVKITINTTDTLGEQDLTFPNEKGYIIIEDNGDGMNYADIFDRWLFISISHKREMKAAGKLTNKKRTPLGDKGLGRLSTQRLGNILEMFSGKKNEDALHHVAFDWRHFTQDSSLEKVNTNYSKTTKGLSKHGTRLIITDLKNSSSWAGDAGNEFRGQLSKLIFPFQEKRPFDIYLTINGQKFDLDEINEKLRKQAIGTYSFSFDGKTLTVDGTLKLSKLQGNSAEKKDIYQQLIVADRGERFFSFLTHPIDNRKNFIQDIKYSKKENSFITFHRTFDFEKDIVKEAIIDNKTSKSIPANPGDFLGEIDEFNLSGTDEIDSAYDKLSEYKLLVKNQVGVRIFRNGFGIKPYGMLNDDWLKLSKSQTSGGSFYLLRPENVIGFVSITAERNKNLIEKTDREGFIDNPYSKNFFNLIDLAILNINQVLERTRRSYDDFKKRNAEVQGGITSFEDTKKRLIDTAKQSIAIDEEASEVFTALKQTSSKVTAAVNKITKEPLFSSSTDQSALKLLQEIEKILKNANTIFEKITQILSNAKILENDANYLEPKINQLESQIIQFSELAGLGLTAETFTHEMFNIIDRLSAQTEQILKQLKKDANGNTAYFLYAEHVRSFVSSIRKQLNHLAPSLKFNRESKQEIKLSSFAKELQDYYNIKFAQKIELKVKVVDDFSVLMNKGKLTQILDNLIFNSEYWLNEMKTNNENFAPSISIEIKSPSLIISDNGYGISPMVEQTLFQAFVTTKPRGKGRGLGLFIVQQLLDSIGGTIVLLNRKNEHHRKFAFEINLDSI